MKYSVCKLRWYPGGMDAPYGKPWCLFCGWNSVAQFASWQEAIDYLNGLWA